MRGAEANLSLSSSDSWSRFVLARLFWNQIFTWVSVSFSCALNSARSAMERYCFSRNFFSSAFSCCVVKGVRGLRFGLCFLSVQRSGPGGGLNLRSANKQKCIYFCLFTPLILCFGHIADVYISKRFCCSPKIFSLCLRN